MINEDQLVAVAEVNVRGNGSCQKVDEVNDWGANEGVLKVDLKNTGSL